jgi:PAS domain S-box-containing protein
MWEMRREGGRLWGAVLQVALVALAYLVSAWLSLRFAYLPDRSSLLWLPAGVALGATYWLGYRVGVVGAGLGMAIAVWLVWRNVPLALLSAVPIGMQAALAAALLHKLSIDPRMKRARDALLFISIAIGTAFVSPLLKALLWAVLGIIPWNMLGQSVLHRWMGDLMGHLLMGGFLLVWWGNWRMRKRDYAMLVLLGMLGAVSAWGMFIVANIRLLPAPPAEFLLPVLVAATLLYQQRGMTLIFLTTMLTLMLDVGRWQTTLAIDYDAFLFGWFFFLITYMTLLLVSVYVAQAREYAQQLEQSYQQIYAILENAPTVAMQMYDEHGRILFWNKASEQVYGYSAEEAVGKTLDELIWSGEEQQSYLQLLQQVARTGQPAPLHEWEVQTSTGERRVILSSLFPIQIGSETRYICADIDITGRKQLEQRLFQAEKLESIGRLAGGVAHDFNNLLTVIIGFAELAQQRLPPDRPARADMERVIQAGEKAANLVRQLLGFARRQIAQPRLVAVNAVVEELLPLLQRTLGENIRIETRLTDADTTVHIDPAQLEQIVMNLAINARDAMAPRGGGTLIIETRRRSPSPEQLQEDPKLQSGESVCLIVRDNGEGIPPEVLPHVFEPFFSTKGLGNTGLGLATVYGIVKQNRGDVRVETRYGVPDSGTTFHIYLPAASENHPDRQV